MIKLKDSFNYKGQILQPGKLVNLPERLEKLLVRNDKAVYFSKIKDDKEDSKDNEDQDKLPKNEDGENTDPVDDNQEDDSEDDSKDDSKDGTEENGIKEKETKKIGAKKTSKKK